MHIQCFLGILTFIHYFYNLCRFRRDCVVTDEIDVTNFIMVDKVVEFFLDHQHITMCVIEVSMTPQQSHHL